MSNAEESKEGICRLPPHLKQYVKKQKYNTYTAIDQAVWRYVMRQNVHHLQGLAHESYLNGLKKTGVSIESIPSRDLADRPLSLELQDDLEKIRCLLRAMDPTDAQVLSLRFGLDGAEPRTLKETGRIIGVTRERVRQIEQRAIVGIRRAFDDMRAAG
mgnify:CR=1 FL=1